MIPILQRPRRASSTHLRVGLVSASAFLFLVAGSFAAPGDLYVTDLASGSVIVYAPDGTATTFATGLLSPQGIAFDQAKNLYVADAGDGAADSGVIYKYTPTGDRSTFYPPTGRTGLDNPIGLTLDGSDLLVSENGADRVLRIPLGNPDQVAIFKITTAPEGLDSRFVGAVPSPSPGVIGTLTRYVAHQDSVLKVSPTMDIEIPVDGPRGITLSRGGTAFVTTASGNLSVITDTGAISDLAMGLNDPHGVDLQINAGGDERDLVFVANTGAQSIVEIEFDGTQTPFVTNAGSPNYLIFENNMTPAPTPTPSPSPSPSPSPTPAGSPIGRAQNISSRVDVQTGNNVGIAGFIINGGTTQKTVAIRAIGPSLAPGVADALADPALELRSRYRHPHE